MWQEQSRVCTALVRTPLKLLVHDDVQRTGTVRAFGRDFHREALVSEAPFDEGRGERILRSSAEDALSGTEPQPVWRSVAGYGKSPAHLNAAVPDQEE